MYKVVVFGNSGSGKSTFARGIVERLGCAHMDLDTVAWQQDRLTPTRLSLLESGRMIHEFMESHMNWVIEGCYSDLLRIAITHATQLVFLNPGKATCVENAKNRPWEPHKYKSEEEQNANLGMLIAWIEQYEERGDEFSLQSHRKLFEEFDGEKYEFNSNDRNV